MLLCLGIGERYGEYLFTIADFLSLKLSTFSLIIMYFEALRLRQLAPF